MSPSEVDAGADMILQAKVACSPAADLRGESVLLKDHDGALAGTLEVTAFDGETDETSACVVTAPAVPGAYTWLAVSPGPAAAMSQEEASTPFSLTVKPHSMRVVVWDAPSAIPCGEAFGVKLGVKCSSECRGDGWTVEIYDHSRKKLAAATLGHEPWAGTIALYHAEVNLSAPGTTGLYAWTATATAADAGLPHTESSVGFGVRVVPTPKCRLTVVAVDADGKPRSRVQRGCSPLPGRHRRRRRGDLAGAGGRVQALCFRKELLSFSLRQRREDGHDDTGGTRGGPGTLGRRRLVLIRSPS